jgi:hypothetical protein
MREQALTTPDTSTHRLRGSTQPKNSAVPAVQQDEGQTPATISESTHTGDGFMNRLLYRSSYLLSFGVVYPVMLVVHVVPKNNAIVHGLVDGALAARQQVESWGAETDTDDLTEEPDHETAAAENGSSLDGKPSDATEHRRRGGRRRGGSNATPKRSSRKR